MSFPQRGEIYWVNLDPTVGSEMAKTRPALIISNNIGHSEASNARLLFQVEWRHLAAICHLAWQANVRPLVLSYTFL